MPGRRGPVALDRRHGDFKTRLLDAMAHAPALAELTTRADDDPAVALADAWAAALHVLSFSIERYHGQSYIDTADDIDAVDALARMVGYRPAPAISAATTLTFRVDDTATGVAAVTRIRRGSKVQTVPGAGDTPVLFETSDDLDARTRWNQLTARRRQVVLPQPTDTALRISQTVIAARPGDAIALIAPKALAANGFDVVLARIDRLDPQPMDASRPVDWIAHQVVWLDGTWTDPSTNQSAGSVPTPPSTIAVFSRRASLFGYNAPAFRLLAKDVRERIAGVLFPAEDFKIPTEAVHREWPLLKARVYTTEDVPTNKIDLDAVYPEAIRGRHLLLVKGDRAELFGITAAQEVARTDHGLSSRVSRLTLDRDPATWDDEVRSTSVLIQTETVTLAESEITATTPADSAPDRLDLAVDCDLPVGRVVVVQGVGTLAADPQVPAQRRAEVAVVKSVQRTNSLTTLVFERPLRGRYDPQTLLVLGNAVAATHGETRMTPAAQGDPGQVIPEVLGSGDARLRYQAFALRQGPLSYVGAANALGYQPEIEVRVNGELRPRLETLYRESDLSRAYALETAADGRTLVRFAGRLPTGTNNVVAVYRVGGGSAGILQPGRLTLALTTVLGLREVTNPMPAAGGVDREDIESARQNAPIRVVTLDRIVSLGDYEAFARAFGGISKALAEVLWIGGRQIVHLTVAGPGGAPVPAGSELFDRLAAAIASASAPGRSFRLLGHTPRGFAVTLAVLTDPAFVRADVERDLQAAFAESYGASRRGFAEPVARSQLLTTAQRCGGVVAARVEQLRDDAGAVVSGEVIGADGATDTAGAQLLTLRDDGLLLQEMVP